MLRVGGLRGHTFVFRPLDVFRLVILSLTLHCLERIMAEPASVRDEEAEKMEAGINHSDPQDMPSGARLRAPLLQPPESQNEQANSPLFARQWQHVLMGLRKKDDDMMKDFNEEIDSLLVFAGLFSAVLTAFIIDVYK